MSEEKKDEILDQEKALDMNELDAVAGGGMCVCPFVGGGTADSPNEKPCGCVVGGGGEWTQANEFGNKGRCVCPLVGEGKE